MVKTLCAAAAACSIVLLLAGSMASDYASLTNGYVNYAVKADAAPIRLLSMIILVSAVLAGLFFKSEESE